LDKAEEVALFDIADEPAIVSEEIIILLINLIIPINVSL